MMDDLSPAQIEALNEMVARRMQNTGEDRRTACLHINKYLIRRAAGLFTEHPFK